MHKGVKIEKKMQEEVSSMDPWSLFLYGMKAPMTREKYKGRLANFLTFLGCKAQWKSAPVPSPKGARQSQTGCCIACFGLRRRKKSAWNEEN